MLRGERRVDADSSRICRDFNLVSDRTGLNFSEYLPYLVNRVGWLLVTDFGQNTLARHQLSIAMWRVLAVLADDDGQRQIDVAASTSIDVSTLSRVVTRMVKMGLVSRTRSATSNREVTVRLTPKGAAILARIIPHAIELERRAISGVPAEDLNVIRRSLRRMYQNLAASERLSRTIEAPLLRASAASADSSRHRQGGRTRR
ncbi:MAG: winged helix-turn-helix transcriptional regulator [Alphaproteobacteria bacterium]|nr:MAG: winged helix-turn-helix transcriptional regulator [Alphaproteobacteria bacterium]TMJ84434.1 MAG: winged helix-turn-helix transcriptional regulator [Alphaproteobacteria bacterium]TMK04265.1 MAG: winged helix-turn-helix transcriptional regulator [Alphaproteobacteria bacterium]